eukprot:TRINITY_DN1158_c0_g1_i4.p2 TRINITY_DN1158_c0_g1~~TRINITY_DN1158_c0_g1_i4.p2  ORF type:complete len:508 (-),score=79.56 TRINITY_DN1158_c0_g1_i4:286-1809(-)
MVKERTNVTYEEAKRALEVCDGDVLESLIYIEKNQSQNLFNEEDNFYESIKNSISLDELKAYFKEVIDKGNVTRIKIKKDEKELVDIPVNAGVAATIIGIIIPPILAVAIIAAVATKITIEITKKDGTVEVVNKYVSKAANDVKEKAMEVANDVKEKTTDIVEVVKNKVKKDNIITKDKTKVYTGGETIYTYTVEFEEEEKKDSDEQYLQIYETKFLKLYEKYLVDLFDFSENLVQQKQYQMVQLQLNNKNNKYIQIFLVFNRKRDKMNLSSRQEQIINLVKENQPITSEALAERLGVTRAALRADLAVLTMIETLAARPKVGYVYLGESSSNFVYNYISKIKVSEIMSKPITVNEETMVYDAIVFLFLNDVGTLFIENNGILTGAVSRKDFLKISIGGTDIHKVPVGVIMTRMPNIICAHEDDNAYDLAKKIIDHEIDSIPVVKGFINSEGKNGIKIIGKVSKTNITKLFVKLGRVKGQKRIATSQNRHRQQNILRKNLIREGVLK